MPDLTEALRYTLIGMSMTFGAIGALVLGMYLLTNVIPHRKEETVEHPEAAPLSNVEPIAETRDEARALAAAAAVAVAISQTNETHGTRHEVTGTSQWRRYVRTHHLEQRGRATHRTFRKRPEVQIGRE
jgi:Na+-transporting methylmalonyl-CoA/oxaloacetate decarboxylase gamma subunit